MSPKRTVANLGSTLTLVLLVTVGGLPVNNAASAPPAPPLETSDSQGIGSLSGVFACGTAFEQGGSSGYRCFMEQLVNGILMDQTTHYANAYGKRLFGEHFSLANRLTYSQLGGGFSGEVDAVVPLSALAGFIGFGGQEDGADPGALFFQQGVTSWTDGQGLRRYDMRYGVVRRFNVSDEPGGNVVGLSTFFQQNLEYGHGRVVSGFDYDGAWGRSTFNYFLPTTGWRDARSRAGYEERALAGMELSTQLQPTSTLSVETALTRWEARDGAGRWETGARVGVSWQPHAWVKIRTAWDGIGTSTPNPSASAFLTFPLGGREPIPGWQGLDLGSLAQNHATMDIWRPIDNIGQIRVAERVTTPSLADTILSGLAVRFLQDDAGSGEEIKVEVTLSAPVSEEIRLLVQLVPGAGDNPAVPGEDYLDEPVEVSIGQGSTSGVATIQLLRNADMTEARSLGVTVSLVEA
jgi:hypothetical protein